MKKVKVKTPSGKVVFHYRRERPNFLSCTNCGAKLNGIPPATSQQLRKLAASEKVPSRPYGAQLCSRCMRNIFREKARMV